MTKKILWTVAALVVFATLGTSAYAYNVDLSNPEAYSPQAKSGSALGTSSSLSLEGNWWAVITLGSTFTVQANSVLTFSYLSTELPEIAAIVFDSGKTYTHIPDQDHAICFGGTDGWSNAAYQVIPSYQVGDGLVTYTIPLAFLGVGETFNFLAFANDDDDGGPTSNGYFCNVSISATPIPGAVWLLGTGVLGLFGLRRKIRG